MKSWLRSKSPAAVLGLALNGTQIEGTVVRRSNGATQLGSTFRHTFSADPLTADPAVLGPELQAALDAAEIRERLCTVALPASWALALSTTLPKLSDTDAQSLMQLEAERGFSFPLESLTIVASRFTTPAGAHHATQFAIQRERITRLQLVLRAARLTPVSFTLGALRTVGMVGTLAETGALTLLVSPAQVEVIATCQGGIAALRTWELPIENPGRELRVTLAQLPPEVQSSLQRLRLVSIGATVDHLAAELRPRASALGLEMVQVNQFGSAAAGANIPAGTPVSPAVAVAAAHLAGHPQTVEFLPPHVSAWRQYSQRYASRKLVAVGQVAGAMAALVLVAFLWQQFQLTRLNSQWKRISSRVHAAEDIQQQIKRFRPWYDTSVRSLAILRRLTEAFPEDGEVTAKIIEIRENGTVTCSGTAQNQAALLRTMERLRSAKDVADVQLDQVRGKAPMQFTFNFQWAGASR